MRVIVHLFAESFAGPKDVRLRDGGMSRASLGKQITAKQCARLLFHQKSALPRVRQMRSIKPSHSMLAQREGLTIGNRARRAISKVANRNHRRDLATEWDSLRSHGEPFVQRTALV